MNCILSYVILKYSGTGSWARVQNTVNMSSEAVFIIYADNYHHGGNSINKLMSRAYFNLN